MVEEYVPAEATTPIEITDSHPIYDALAAWLLEVSEAQNTRRNIQQVIVSTILQGEGSWVAEADIGKLVKEAGGASNLSKAYKALRESGTGELFEISPPGSMIGGRWGAKFNQVRMAFALPEFTAADEDFLMEQLGDEELRSTLQHVVARFQAALKEMGAAVADLPHIKSPSPAPSPAPKKLSPAERVEEIKVNWEKTQLIREKFATLSLEEQRDLCEQLVRSKNSRLRHASNIAQGAEAIRRILSQENPSLSLKELGLMFLREGELEETTKESALKARYYKARGRVNDLGVLCFGYLPDQMSINPEEVERILIELFTLRKDPFIEDYESVLVSRADSLQPLGPPTRPQKKRKKVEVEPVRELATEWAKLEKLRTEWGALSVAEQEARCSKYLSHREIEGNHDISTSQVLARALRAVEPFLDVRELDPYMFMAGEDPVSVGSMELAKRRATQRKIINSTLKEELLGIVLREERGTLVIDPQVAARLFKQLLAIELKGFVKPKHQGPTVVRIPIGSYNQPFPGSHPDDVKGTSGGVSRTLSFLRADRDRNARSWQAEDDEQGERVDVDGMADVGIVADQLAEIAALTGLGEEEDEGDLEEWGGEEPAAPKGGDLDKLRLIRESHQRVQRRLKKSK